MELQHINTKIYLKDGIVPESEKIVSIFHKWIQEKAAEELLIDVADYKHVPNGPGVILIGHEANYSLDYGPENRAGLLYNVKIKKDGNAAAKISHSLKQAAKACERMEKSDGFKFNPAKIRVIFNDRALVANTEESFHSIKSELQQVFGKISDSATFEKVSLDPRERLTVQVSLSGPRELSKIAETLG